MSNRNHKTPFAQTVRRVELFFRKILTVNHTALFWCDSKIRLCRNCNILRSVLRGEGVPKCMAVIDKDATVWICKLWGFEPPYSFTWKKRRFVVLDDRVVELRHRLTLRVPALMRD